MYLIKERESWILSSFCGPLIGVLALFFLFTGFGTHTAYAGGKASERSSVKAQSGDLETGTCDMSFEDFTQQLIIAYTAHEEASEGGGLLGKAVSSGADRMAKKPIKECQKHYEKLSSSGEKVERALNALERVGAKVPGDIEEFIEWCKKKGEEVYPDSSE